MRWPSALYFFRERHSRSDDPKKHTKKRTKKNNGSEYLWTCDLHTELNERGIGVSQKCHFVRYSLFYTFYTYTWNRLLAQYLFMGGELGNETNIDIFSPSAFSSVYYCYTIFHLDRERRYLQRSNEFWVKMSVKKILRVGTLSFCWCISARLSRKTTAEFFIQFVFRMFGCLIGAIEL